MQIIVTGVNHGTAPLGVRERLAVSTDELPDVLGQLRATAGDCFILSTCNRVEVYAICGHEGSGADRVHRWFAARGGLNPSEIGAYFYTRGHEQAVRHAFRVAAGLDSMIVGEDQILGQMRRALAVARKAGVLGPILERMGSSALACGKRVRTSTELGNASPSVVSVAIDAAGRARGTLEGARAVLIGSGETASLALRQLEGRGLARITVVGRSMERAGAMALAHGVDAAPWESLPAQLGHADVVIGCTASPHPVLTVEAVRTAREASASPLVCVDLGVPRDMEPALAGLAGVSLIDIDQLGGPALQLRVERHRQIEAAEEVVTDEVERFMAWWRERAVAPAIARLHAHGHRIREAELERALSRLTGLSERERDAVRTLAERLTSKLLHDPTVALKRDPEGANMAMMLERLFRLTPDGEGAAPAGHASTLSHQRSGDDA